MEISWNLSVQKCGYPENTSGYPIPWMGDNVDVPIITAEFTKPRAGTVLGGVYPLMTVPPIHDHIPFQWNNIQVKAMKP